MKSVWMIRHAESLGNAGQPTDSSASTKLSALGLAQATAFASQLKETPSLIVTSPYDRAVQTAEPLRTMHPSLRYEVWQSVREFTYLNEEKYRGTTYEERKLHVAEYWKQNDPDYHDGGMAESFADFMRRISVMLEDLQKINSPLTIVMTHEFVIKSIAWIILSGCHKYDAVAMSCFDAFRKGLLIPNMAKLPISFDVHTRHFRLASIEQSTSINVL